MGKFLASVLSLLIATASAASTLQSKLDAQFERYQDAQDLLLTTLKHGNELSREDWEATILQNWSDVDLQELRRSQALRIFHSYESAKKSSKIDLDIFRRDQTGKAVRNFCSRFPKGGMLHIHPSGTLDIDTVQSLLSSGNPLLNFSDLLDWSTSQEFRTTLYPQEILWLRSRPSPLHYNDMLVVDQRRYQDFFFLPRGSHSFPRFESVFNFISTAIQTWDHLEKAWMDFAIRAREQNVSYVEFTTGVNSQSLKMISSVLEKLERETGLTFRLNRSFVRSKSAEDLKKDLNDLLSLPENKWVVGIDLLSNEEGTPALEKAQVVYGGLLNEVKKGRSRLRRTMHSGEHGDPRNPRDALIMGSERLGHATLLHKDPVALEFAVKKSIPIEINLTSNLKLRSVSQLKAHPYLDYLRLGLPVSLSTDDEGIFKTNINKECELAINTSNITYTELKQMSYNALHAAFVEKSVKEQLISKLNRSFESFEAQN